jgi:acetoin utilization protein AcuB
MTSVEPIRKFMTPTPRTIGVDQTLQDASEWMRKLQVRHLPVLKAGELVGIVSERDIHLLLTFAEQDALNMPVEEAMTPDPFFTTPDTPLAEVAALMAKRKYGSAVVMDNKKVVGIFTAVDALEALSDMLKSKGTDS